MRLLKFLTVQWTVIICSSWAGGYLYGQNPLTISIQIDSTGEMSVGAVLDQIQKSQDFYFSFNSQSVPTDSVIAVSGFSGTIKNYLQSILSDDFEFKSTPGYVIIRYAPRSMGLSAEIDKKDQSIVINGRIRDTDTGTPVEYASIYERNALVSTLSDENGYFSLLLKKPGTSNWITVTKENYKDTTLVIFSPVQIRNKNKRSWLYIPEEENNNSDIYRSFFGRLFISTRQRIQRINIGGFFAYSPYQISLAPGVSSQGLFNSQIVNHLSVNLAGGYTAGVDGVEIAGGFNINQKHVKYFQAAGGFNLAGGRAVGMQLAGGANIIMENVNGVQVSGLLNTTNGVKGMQISGAVNRSTEARGIQVAGISNFAEEMHGLQISGLLNQTTGLQKSIQVSGIGNLAYKKSSGIQLAGIFNYSKGKTGSQFAGIINKGGNVKGLQFTPLINIADSSDFPIAILNFIKTGEKSIGLEIDESGVPGLVFRSGGRFLYGLLGISYDSPSSEAQFFKPEVGIGARFYRGVLFSFDAELTNQTNTDLKTHSHSRLAMRPITAVNLGNHMRLAAGPSLNFTFGNNINTDRVKVPGWILFQKFNENDIQALHVGIRAELQYTWK